MLRLSKKADSASARDITERYDSSVALLAKVLQQLARRGFRASHMGIHGEGRLSLDAADGHDFSLLDMARGDETGRPLKARIEASGNGHSLEGR